MVRRLVGVGAILLLILLSAPACQKDGANKKASTVVDPDAGAVPKPAGKAG
jgi:hypothetical protein